MNLHKLLIWLTSLLSLILIIISAAIFIPKYKKLKDYEKKIIEIEAELAEKKVEISKLREQLNGLVNDPEIIEKFAREKYGFCRENEIIYTYNKEELSKLVGPVGIEPTTR